MNVWMRESSIPGFLEGTERKEGIQSYLCVPAFYEDSLPFRAISVSTVPGSVQRDCWGCLLRSTFVLLPASLSLTSPMVHSQLPCPLFLLCSLLMLPSVLLQEVPMPGGLFPVPVTTEEVKEAAAFAVEQYNKHSKNANYFKELDIVKAQSQVVSGMKYYLTVEMGKTVCEKSSGPLPFSDIQKCELLPQDQQEKLTCDFQIWSRPWLKDTQLLSTSCS
ncbi:hypothetical protein L345_14827 [Ophiophagus hannah]|uniref:Cystatin n=1 Tax=Ophiophagus hannah TaxID=8665 RepID=V8NCS2_OPHHA|nr:hypothetical protein L345_14827 [Ophiophagus hannah]